MIQYPGSLHNHTDFSNFRLRDSINTVESLINKAIELGHEVVAITDHETVASSIRVEKYYDTIKKEHPNFKVLRGNEIYLCRNGLTAQNFNKEVDKYYHFLLLAIDAEGHEQIRELSTRAWLRSFTERRMQRVPTYYQDLFDIIVPNRGHVIGSTACIGGTLGTQLLKYKETGDAQLYEKLKYWCRQMEEIFGKGFFYIELQPSFDKEQVYVNSKLIELSKELDIPFIITNDAHYLRPEDRVIHKAYLNSKQGDREVDSFYKTTYLMTDKEIHNFLDIAIGEDNIQEAYQNILDIKNKCQDFSLRKPLKIPRLNWKTPSSTLDTRFWVESIPELKVFLNSKYEEDKRLAQLIIERIEQDDTLQSQETYDEVNACLHDTWVSSEVNGSRWSAYFLNLQNIIDCCWDSGTLVGCGRGSGVGFILLYILGITQINPLREKTKCFRWRFLNPERVSVLDVDIDIEGGRRSNVLHNFRKVYGEDRVANVLTLGTEKSKQAILTAARGLGIDVDTAQYISSMIVADRGMTRTLKQTYYGDEENGYEPNKQFQSEMKKYPELWRVAQYIEGLICRVGVHAGGVIFVDEPFTNSTALMRSPKGEIITQFDLHDAEETGLIKYDILSVEALDKIHNCLDLLENDDFIKGDNLKDRYEKTIGIYNLERTNPEMWEMCWNHEVMSLFQMEKMSGIAGIAAMKPTSVDDLAILNSTIRLMAQKKGDEMPINKLARFKADSRNWDKELAEYGLGSKEKAILEPIVGMSYGLCIAQEQFMELVQLEELGGFSLTWADKLRKSIAKKNPAAYDALTQEYFEVVREKNLDYGLCSYVWNVLIAMSKGYGFNQSHTLAYSLIGLQELNLAYRYPILYWDCACLIADSGGNEQELEENEDENEEFFEEFDDVNFGVFEESDDEEDEDEEDAPTKTEKKKKKKTKTANYGKIATAIGRIISEGIEVSAPDINKSSYTFRPDLDTNSIRYGLSGITRVGDDIVKNIITERPYESLTDFLKKVKVNKPQMVNLIKSGAFDEFGKDRFDVMRQYIDLISDKKKRITLQNMKMLIDFDLLPPSLEFECMVFNFNKYLKKYKSGEYYVLDANSTRFYEAHFDMDKLFVEDEQYKLPQTIWDAKYKKLMDPVRAYMKQNQEDLLNKLNQKLFDELWNKYCTGTISKWEMDSVSYYSHEHELANVDLSLYDCVNYFTLPDEPIIDNKWWKDGKQIVLYKIFRIAGTILEKDKNKGLVTLLTKEGVVTVKIFGPVFTTYDKQISERRVDGTKKIIEKSWLSRGNKIIVTGIKRDDSFLAKKYARTPYHLVELIDTIDKNGNITTKQHRYGEEPNDN